MRKLTLNQDLSTTLDAKGHSEKRGVEFSSCRFCTCGAGKHLIVDTDKNEQFNICDFHLAKYDIDTDKIRK